jgi:hypothetical protein
MIADNLLNLDIVFKSVMVLVQGSKLIYENLLRNSNTATALGYIQVS